MSSLIVSLWHSRITRFLAVGGTATLLQMLLLMLFVELEILRPVVASAASYLISAFYNYSANYYFTFGASTSKRHAETAPKFALVCVIGITANTLTFSAVNHILELYVVAQLVAIFVTLIVNYTLHKCWIYRG